VDPLTHWALGTSTALSASKSDTKKYSFKLVLFFAGIGAVIPDIDSLIQSTNDPLLYVQYHRHFTHSLILTPIYSFIVAALGISILKMFKLKVPPLKNCWKWAFYGIATHGLLDAMTSYGTHLWWPLSGSSHFLEHDQYC
jgi:inner membrane protein